MAEVARSLSARAPLLLAVSIVLLALLAYNLRSLDPGGETLPPVPGGGGAGPGAEARFGAGEVLRVMYVASILVLLLVVLVGMFVLWRSGVPFWKLVSPWEVLGIVLAGLAIALLFSFYSDVHEALRGVAEGLVGGSRETGGSGEGGGLVPLNPSDAPSVVLVGVSGLAAAYVAVFALLFFPRLYRLLTAKGASPDAARREFARAVGAAIRGLESGGDFRTVVLRCYRAMVLLFASRGVVQAANQTAREFQEDALDGFGVSREGIERLTGLFEEARYSAHTIGASERDAAIESLAAVRRELEAGA